MYELINTLVRALKKVVPESVVRALRRPYHATLAFIMALSYGFPARELVVIGVTGTKGKSTVADMLFQVFKSAGYKTALISTIRFAIDDESEPNKYKMTLQGRGFAQAFMRRARKAGCTHLIIEVTSESVLQNRHKFLSLDALVVTNIQKEHIESHGSFENYVAAKKAIVDTLVHSTKKNRVIIANEDVPETKKFLDAPVPKAIGFSSSELKNVMSNERSTQFTYDNTAFTLPLPGTFNAVNALAAIKLASAFGIPPAVASQALSKLPVVRGRVEHIDAGQDFLAIVDYAHTPDSLRALYTAFPNKRKICVLGNTGGGRDTWKRPLMGKIAEEFCDEVILTNEDPYDEDPQKIVADMARGMEKSPTIIMDRHEAIRYALTNARRDDAVLISGKGTDPYIMGPHGTKIPWNDADVIREELHTLLAKSV